MKPFIFLRQEMEHSNICIFINKKKNLYISPFSSLYSFRQKVKETFYPSLTTTLNIYFKQKKLTNDYLSLHKIGITENSEITAIPSLKGGLNTTYYFLWFCYYLFLIIYILFLLSGFLPVFANAFAYTFNNTVFQVLDWFTKGKKSAWKGFLRIFVRIVSWLINNLATLFFVWAMTAYMIFPWLYGKENKFCESALASKRIGWWTMFIFILIYGSLNLVDAMINIYQALLEEFPDLLQAFGNPTLQGIKEAWDIAKFAPLYLIPGVITYHEIIGQIVFYLYDIMQTIGAFDCQDPSQSKTLCTLFETLSDMAQRKKAGTSEKSEKSKQKAFVDNYLKKKKSNDPESLGSLGEMMLGSASVELQNFKLGSAFSLLSRGFCDIYEKDTYGELKEDSKYPIGSFGRWSAEFFTSFFCQFVQALVEMQNTLYGIGTDFQVVNMIKTGNFAGIGAVIYFIIIIIYTWFSDSFAGYKYG
jgi:hypothetical protein